MLKIDKNLDKHQSDNEQNEHKDGDEFSQQALLFDKGIVDDSQLNLVNKMLPPKWFLKVKIVVSHDYCRVSIGGVPFTVDVGEPKPNRPNTMNLVEKWAQELGFCEDFVNGRAGSLGSRIVNGIVGGGGSKSVLEPHPRMSSSSPPLILHN